jgi:hypothetical protein
MGDVNSCMQKMAKMCYGQNCEGYYQYQPKCLCIDKAFVMIAESVHTQWTSNAKLILESQFDSALKIVDSTEVIACGCCTIIDKRDAVNMLNRSWVPKINKLLKPFHYYIDAIVDTQQINRKQRETVIIIRIFNTGQKVYKHLI